MPRMIGFVFLLCLAFDPPIKADDSVEYARDIKPLLRERCYSCHGVLKQKAGLRLDAVALMKEGGDNGPALEPGKADQSAMVARLLAEGRMRMPPPDQGEAFTEKQIALLKRWINEGAIAPPNDKPEEDPKSHWAFRVPTRPTPPQTGHPVDAFHLDVLKKQGLTPQPPASKEVVLRRVYLDVIGLPPTRGELHAFLKDDSPQAYEKVVDDLLARPQYGERWARHWMDVWRYSDWYGRRNLNDLRNSYAQIWRWRDWIVRSINADKGYDRMLQEMLAADEICPEDAETQVATGFLGRNWYSLNPNQWMRDMVEHTGKAFLGLTFNCAHCHDHKYDPISHEDYFRFRAFFEPLGMRQDRVPGQPDPGPFSKYVYPTSIKPTFLGQISVFDENPNAKTAMYLQGDERQRVPGKEAIPPGVPKFFGRDAVRIEPIKLPREVAYPALKSWWRKEELATRIQEVDNARKALEETKDATEAKLALEIAEGQLESFRARLAADDVHFKVAKGDFVKLAKAASQSERYLLHKQALAKWKKAEGDVVSLRAKVEESSDAKDKAAAQAKLKKAEGVLANAKKTLDKSALDLSAESTKYSPLTPKYPEASTGRRKALAEWVTSSKQPLTARVAVNHVWLRHFDQPLVATVFDFGRNGKKPTHPELLDWLAVEFMESGWSMKHLHRLILTSNVYRMQTNHGDNAEAVKDPDNHYLWKFPGKRMEAEVVRDCLLALTGELDLTQGGKSLDNKDELTSRRRSLYFDIFPEDGGHPKFIEIFDAPDPCDCYKRATSVIPQQALALINNPLALSQSRVLAEKLGKAMSEGDFIQAAFETVLTRSPTAEEASLCREFLGDQRTLFESSSAKELQTPPGADRVPASRDVVQRARESLVRVLFNHHDFVTIK